MFLMSSADFFKSNFLKKNLSGTLAECISVWIQIRTDILFVLNWVETVPKGYKQMTKAMASKEKVAISSFAENHIYSNTFCR